jgi:hypothetical protein
MKSIKTILINAARNTSTALAKSAKIMEENRAKSAIGIAKAVLHGVSAPTPESEIQKKEEERKQKAIKKEGYPKRTKNMSDAMYHLLSYEYMERKQYCEQCGMDGGEHNMACGEFKKENS